MNKLSGGSVGLQMLADAGQIDEPVIRSQQMACEHVPFHVEAVNSASCDIVDLPDIDLCPS
jgi:hypothetical protein